MNRGDEAERAAIQAMDQRSRMIDQISELMARVLENISQKKDLEKNSNSDIEEAGKNCGAMNRFTIAEKYNEIGKTKPKEFIKWLLNNLSEHYRKMLKGTLNHMLEMLSHYEHAQRASDWKIRMPWDKEDKTVEPEYYAKQKEAFYKAEMPGVLKSLGIENDAYMDPEVIKRAHVLENYISEQFEKTYKESIAEGKKIDQREYLAKRQRALDSIDFGVAEYGFKFNMSGEDVEVVIRPRDEMEKLSKAAGVEGQHSYLLREEAVTKDGQEYYLIDATDELYRDIVVFDMFSKRPAEGIKTESALEEDSKSQKKANESIADDKQNKYQAENKIRTEGNQKALKAMQLNELYHENGMER